MSNINVSHEKLAHAPQFIEEVKEAFNTSIPPISIQIDNREDVKSFAMIFKSKEHSYHGKRISCKNAKSFAPSTYAAVEIYTLENDRFPIELFFKSIQDLEDFADGYLRAVETVPAPTERTLEPTPTPQKVIKEEHTVTGTSPRENKRNVRRDSYEVNPFAETLLDTVLKIVLVIGWTLAVGSIVVSIFLAAEMEQYFIILLGVLGAAIILLTYYSVWAINKVIINMSRSLYNINERLKDNE